MRGDRVIHIRSELAVPGYADTLVLLEAVPLFLRRPQLFNQRENIVRSGSLYRQETDGGITNLRRRQGQLRAEISLHPQQRVSASGPLGYGPAWNWTLEQMGNGSAYRTATGVLVLAQSGQTESALRAYHCRPCLREDKLQVVDIQPQL